MTHKHTDNDPDHLLKKQLSPEAFFNYESFDHKALFVESFNDKPKPCFVWDLLPQIKPYIDQRFTNNSSEIWGEVSRDALLMDGGGPIFIGEGSVVEAGAYIAGPTIIGRECTIRRGAYIRGNVIMGDKVVVGNASEVKHSILLDDAHAPHFNYVGDSILGNGVNLGAGTKLSNLSLVSIKDPVKKKRPTLKLTIESVVYDTGLQKLGAILGDYAQTGCNSVLNPGCLVGQQTLVYANVSLRKGYYQPRKIIKLRQNQKIADLNIVPLS